MLKLVPGFVEEDYDQMLKPNALFLPSIQALRYIGYLLGERE